MDWAPLILTFQLAILSTAILLVIGVPLAAWLAFRKNAISPFIEALIGLPLVLPPTVIGFYLLLAFSPESQVGSLLNDWFGLQLAFSFEGLVIASVIYSLPFMIQPIQSGLENLPPSYREACKVMGKSDWQSLRYALLPAIKPSLLSALVLSFAHTVGEFGVVLMIGGSIPEETRVASIAIYDEVEKLNYASAHQYALFLLALSFVVLSVVYLYRGRSKIRLFR